MTVGERLKQLREKSGMSQVEFAAILNVSKQNLYKYENNIITNIPSDKIEDAAKILNVSPSYIMGWDSPAQVPLEHSDDPDIRRIERARKNMPETDKKFMMDILTRSFSEYFEDDGSDDPD